MIQLNRVCLHRTNQPFTGSVPSEDLNFWLCAIYDSRYSHQDYDSVLGGVHEINTPDLTSIHLSFFILRHI